MPDYKGIQGTAVQNFAGDPANPIIGQVWYNSISGRFRYNEVAPQLGAWQTGGSLNTARRYLAGAGTQTAALAFGGFTTAATGATESYNGTAWTTSPASLNTARQALAGCGATNTAALAFGGVPVTAVNESWNGTTWTELGDLNTARRILGGVGINTAALAFGGLTTVDVGNTETWNGTAWTEVNDLNTVRNGLAGSGTNTVALAFGGTPNTAPAIANTESWNGTSWSQADEMNTARQSLAGAGTQTAALAFGGAVTGTTEAYNDPYYDNLTITTTV
jgi:hypothetical protein